MSGQHEGSGQPANLELSPSCLSAFGAVVGGFLLMGRGEETQARRDLSRCSLWCLSDNKVLHGRA